MVQLEGTKTSQDDRILFIGATNRPQELDEAVRRRFVKKLYIPLPNDIGRRELIENIVASELNLENRFELNEADKQFVVQQTKGYSGADLRNLFAEASYFPVRDIWQQQGHAQQNQMQFLESKSLRPTNRADLEQAIL